MSRPNAKDMCGKVKQGEFNELKCYRNINHDGDCNWSSLPNQTKNKLCWHCGGSMKNNGKIVVDKIGNVHDVHGICFDDANVKEFTATGEETNFYADKDET